MDFRIAAFVRRFLIEHQVDIVHTHRCKDTVLGTLAAKSAPASPHVVRTVHGLSEALRGWKRAKLVAYEVARQGDALVFCRLRHRGLESDGRHSSPIADTDRVPSPASTTASTSRSCARPAARKTYGVRLAFELTRW